MSENDKKATWIYYYTDSKRYAGREKYRDQRQIGLSLRSWLQSGNYLVINKEKIYTEEKLAKVLTAIDKEKTNVQTTN